ncbi:MAG: hypothetical protein DRI22_00110 [Caldiserica bacterium]|nr:MAG: hypothetical protein DRI22_00110 [Caldisericota bacterium]
MPFPKQEHSPIAFAETIIKTLSRFYPEKIVNEAFLITALENLSKMGACEVDPRHKRFTVIWTDEDNKPEKPLKKEVYYVDTVPPDDTILDSLSGYPCGDIDYI